MRQWRLKWHNLQACPQSKALRKNGLFLGCFVIVIISAKVRFKLANCAILGVIGALKLALASKLPRQGVNWRVDYLPPIFPLFAFIFTFFSTPSKKRDFPSLRCLLFQNFEIFKNEFFKPNLHKISKRWR